MGTTRPLWSHFLTPAAAALQLRRALRAPRAALRPPMHAAVPPWALPPLPSRRLRQLPLRRGGHRQALRPPGVQLRRRVRRPAALRARLPPPLPRWRLPALCPRLHGGLPLRRPGGATALQPDWGVPGELVLWSVLQGVGGQQQQRVEPLQYERCLPRVPLCWLCTATFHLRVLQCTRVCGALLDCGRHSCTEVCHAGPCAPCQLAGPKACPCGKEQLPHSACDVVVPPCGQTCGKLLGCGRHTCNERWELAALCYLQNMDRPPASFTQCTPH